MSESEINKATELVEREGIRTTKMTSVTIFDDGTNEVAIPGFPYRFKAQGDKLLISVDIFKSGYECKDCAGTGRIKHHCPCEDTERPGFKYSWTNDTERVAYSPAQQNTKCPYCQGNYESIREDKECETCKGKGATIIIPDVGKNLPTTGVIVSVGGDVKNSDYKNHVRVLFGAYTGVMIPTKAPGIVFKVIREHEVLCTIRGGEDLAAFDFVVTDKDLGA